jgi:type I restriction enzyme S subunit
VRPGLQLRPKFLEFVLNSRLVQRQVAVGSVGALQSHFNTGALANVWVVVPDLDEQDRLLAHLSIQIGRYDSLIESLGNLMLLLSEHRQALITAAVAGGLGAVGRAA